MSPGLYHTKEAKSWMTLSHSWKKTRISQNESKIADKHLNRNMKKPLRLDPMKKKRIEEENSMVRVTDRSQTLHHKKEKASVESFSAEESFSDEDFLNWSKL